MVAISLYRGNLHKVPDVPRQWLMPNPKITPRDFKTLLKRRSVALSRLLTAAAITTATTSISPNVDVDPTLERHDEAPKHKGSPCQVHMGAENAGPSGGEPPEEVKDEKGLDNRGECSINPIDEFDSLPSSKPDVPEQPSDPAEDHGLVRQDGNMAEIANPNLEASNEDLTDAKKKRKREIDEKLEVLNSKKHNLVQVLKQILHVEEELKRRNSMQGMTIRPSVSVPVDSTTDIGSIIKHIAPRIGSEANIGGDVEAGEADNLSNHNFHPRQMHRTSSMSPSSESPLRRPANIQHNVGSTPSRGSLGTGGSPSRFGPMGQQGHPTNLPTVSVSATSYIASSPSPAASGGTSVFRDARQPSPWN